MIPRRITWMLTGLLIAVLLVVVIVVLPNALVHTGGSLTAAEQLKAENDIRSTLVQALAGAVLLAGLYFTAQPLRVNTRTLELNREGQITERFTRAIDQLGQPGTEKIDVRLGGIYALERIASASSADHGPIMEVLTAFLREHARWKPEQSAPPQQEGDATTSRPLNAVRPPADIQAIMTVLGRRNRDFDEPARTLDLSGIDLRGADLRGAHLERSSLRETHLEGANLSGTHLTGASLHAASLQRAILLEARLEAVDLGDADLEGSSLRGASLEDAALGGARLSGADLADADLRRAFLGGTQLDGVNLSYANLEAASLPGAQLERAVLYATRVDGTEFGECNLEGATLRETDLSAASGLTRHQLEAAITDGTTTLPRGH